MISKVNISKQDTVNFGPKPGHRFAPTVTSPIAAPSVSPAGLSVRYMRSEAEVRSNSTADAITAINKRSIE